MFYEKYVLSGSGLPSTNLYGSLRFGTNERVLLRRRYPNFAALCAPVTTTKGEGYSGLFLVCLSRQVHARTCAFF